MFTTEGRNKLKRAGSERLCVGVEVAAPAGGLAASLGSFHMEFVCQGKQLANVHNLICGFVS